MHYWTYEDAIIFYPKFNDKLDANMLSNYKKIIFSNYKFNENKFNENNYIYIYEIYKINNLFYDKNEYYEYNEFNKPVNILSPFYYTSNFAV